MLWGYNAFGLSLPAPGRRRHSVLRRPLPHRLGAHRGRAYDLVGIIANLQVYFMPTSLFDTLLILGPLAGGLGLVARSLRAQGSGGADSYPAGRVTP